MFRQLLLDEDDINSDGLALLDEELDMLGLGEAAAAQDTVLHVLEGQGHLPLALLHLGGVPATRKLSQQQESCLSYNKVVSATIKLSLPPPKKLSLQKKSCPCNNKKKFFVQ